MKMRPRLPKKGTPEYAQLCGFFGLDDAAIDAGLFSPHYVHLSEYLTVLAGQGAQIPDGLLGQSPEPNVIYRRRKAK